MSSVSGIGQADLTQILQRVKGGGGRPGRAHGGQRPEPTAEQKQQFETKFQAAAKELGIDGSQFAKVGGQIKDAVQSVVQANQGSSPDALQKAISEKVDSVLKDNNIDPATYKQQFQQVLAKLKSDRAAGGGKDADGDNDGTRGATGPGGIGGAGGPGGFGAFAALSGSKSTAAGTYSQTSTTQTLLQQFLKSTQTQDAQVSSFFSSASSGSFVDIAA